MSTRRVDHRTLSGLFNAKGFYTLGFSFIFGMSLWVTFFAGIIAFKALPRHQFGTLQQRTFPIYFNLNIIISSGLLLAWIRNHSLVIAHARDPTAPDVVQAYALAVVTVSQALNSFWIGPSTKKVMMARHKLEKAEGKNAHDTDVSAHMRALNVKFSRWHGLSSLANLIAFLALAFHGLWIGNYGITA
ncbi:hypothetical protein B0F90DRAFT_1679373 [Multifurca ochricompacta]|uniref:TMEM205-like domain-containing protein n=1 Tax=Multifurca ochricompacta TaxID=376703 RepID=A0AAD4QU44_9AGAM|nr:hypothetical protein B0F90DRAFT_1679373 [Multifurca ochricompacta]